MELDEDRKYLKKVSVAKYVDSKKIWLFFDLLTSVKHLLVFSVDSDESIFSYGAILREEDVPRALSGKEAVLLECLRQMVQGLESTVKKMA